MNRLLAIVAVALVLAACGGGGNGDGLFYIDSGAGPPLTTSDAELAPVYHRGATLHIGTDVSPKRPLMEVEGRPGVSYGRLRDGEGRRSVSTYLAAHAGIGAYKSFEGLETFRTPPTVHIAEGTATRHVAYVVRAVQLLNEVLPHAWRLRIGQDAPALSSEVPDGKIYVDFALWRDWPSWRPPYDEVGGVAEGFLLHDGARRASHVWIEPARVTDKHMLKVVVHEMIHALGLAAHINRLDTIMPQSGRVFWSLSRTAIYPVDREGLMAAYRHLEPTDTPTEIYRKLGDWEDTSTHLMAQTEALSFGVAHRNGFTESWAYGKAPDTDLADSPLSGEVIWDGDLLGFTPQSATVAGDAQLVVELSTLQGNALFDQLETWSSGPPGIKGTGSMWGDGDLAYAIAVRGNVFREVSGDDGVITGAFFGQSHESMGGTLRRDDLDAAFGGDR